MALAAWLGLPAPEAFAVNCAPASNAASLSAAIGAVNAGTCDTINITGNVSLTSQNLPIIDRAGATITIQGQGSPKIVDGTGTSRLFAVINGNVTISNINIENGLAKGGAGGSDNSGGGGAGGALGAGGGLFIGAGGTVTLRNVDLGSNTAQGGAGGNSAAGSFGAGGGGGGLNGGAGGSGSGAISGASGGGGAFGADGGGNANSRGGSGGGGGGNNAAAGSQGTSFSGASGGVGDGGAGGAGGQGDTSNPGADGTGMGGGGGGGSAHNYTAVGDGGDGGALGGGGGGGGQAHFVTGYNGTGDGGAGGDGGFGGGGGGGGSSYQNTAGPWTSGTGGLGGFGAGGGGGGGTGTATGARMVAGSGGAGGVLGGDGGDGAVYIAGGGGGGGAGLGGAIFVQNGGTLSIGQNVTFGGAGANNVAGGAGGSSPAGTAGTAGGAAGANIYAIDGAAGLGSNATVGFDVTGTTPRVLGNADLGLLQAGYSGQLRKSGTGMLVLQSTTGFTTGGWQVTDGTLRGSTDNLLGDLDLVGGTVVIHQAPLNGTYAGDISGSGSLVKSGSGTVTLSGTNSYTGGTTINAGRLQGTTSSLTGNIVNNSSLRFDQSFDGVFAGDLSGGGSLYKQGSGNVTLTGNNDASTGVVQIIQGTLSVNGSGIGDTSIVYLGGSGSLSIGAAGETIGSLIGSGAVTLGGALSAGGNNGSTTFSGDISGGGSLTKTGSGTLTLSGSNTYSGGTTINAGTLTVNGSGIGDTSAVTVNGGGTLNIGASGETIGSLGGSGNVTLGGALTAGGNNSSTVHSGDISGSGSLTKTGSGSLFLSGNNSYTGGTTISGGTLGGTTSSLTGDITNNSTLAFLQAGNGTFAGDISGSGSLVKSGSGTVTLSGTNSYTGGTMILAGTLRGTTLTLVGNITNNSTVEFDQAFGGTYAGRISGSGSLVKSGTGTLTLSGSNSYSGGTTIAAGTLAGTSLSLMGDILNNSTLQFDQAFDGTYADDISGSGALVKSGTGRLNLSGINTYSGTTTVSAGTLAVNGSLTSNVTVASGATLQGTGSVGTTTVNGLLAPGNSIGTLNVTGNLNLTPSSVFEVEFDDAGNADKVDVTGTANLDGTLRLAPGVGVYAGGTQYTILEAATVSGQFANTTVTNEIRLGGLSAKITYAADEVRMALNKASFGGALGPGAGSGPVAEYLDAIRPGLSGDLETDVGVLEVLPLEELDAALQALSPQVADAVPQVQNAFGRVVTDAMEVRLERLRVAELREAGQPSAGFLPQLAAAAVASASAREELLGVTHSFGSLELPQPKSWEDQFLAVAAPNNNAASLFELGNRDYTAWAQLLGEYGDRASDGDLLGYDYRVFGITSGLEQQLTSELDVGALVAVGHSEVNFDRERGANTERTYSAGAYLGWMPAPGVTIDLTGWGGLSRLDGERRIRFAGMDRTADSDTNVYSLGVDLRGEYIQSWRNFRLGGFAGAGFLSNWQEDYCETGAGALNLCVDDANTQQLRGELGLSAAYDVELARGNLVIDVELAATGTLPLDDRMIKSGFVGQEKTFLIPGDDREELGFAPRLELIYQMPDDSELSISYNGQFTENLDAHGVQIGLRIPF